MWHFEGPPSQHDSRSASRDLTICLAVNNLRRLRAVSMSVVRTGAPQGHEAARNGTNLADVAPDENLAPDGTRGAPQRDPRPPPARAHRRCHARTSTARACSGEQLPETERRRWASTPPPGTDQQRLDDPRPPAATNGQPLLDAAPLVELRLGELRVVLGTFLEPPQAPLAVVLLEHDVVRRVPGLRQPLPLRRLDL